jgi:putative redox protein
MYADAKKLPLSGVTVDLRHEKIHAKDCADCDTERPRLDRIERVVALEGNLDEAQHARLMEIADRCPVHRTLEAGVDISTRGAPRRAQGDSAGSGG